MSVRGLQRSIRSFKGVVHFEKKVLGRGYHDETYGFRRPREFTLPDYTQSQIENRTLNAPLMRYVDSMRMHGHRAARIDPLDLMQREEVAALTPTRYGLTDPKKEYDVDGIIWTRPVGDGDPGGQPEMWTLEKIVAHMRAVYVGRIAYEYMHSPSKTERLWFSHVLETPTVDPSNAAGIDTVESKRRIWDLLMKSEVLDQFLQSKFPNLKRYGLEGGESMLPALDALFSSAAFAGIENVVLAMPHRGRLNFLANLLSYKPAAMFRKIKGFCEYPTDLDVSGDVLSHLFTTTSLKYGEGTKAKDLMISVVPNPSHLEAAIPVSLGKTRSKQLSLLRESPSDCQLGDKVMSVQLHGDASFTGQGVIMESLGLSNLPHFTSGGSVHLVVNNNIGYTTPASNARSSLYCSDVGKMIHAPVLHVNGDHPQDVARAMEIAFKYRQAFRKDIIVDLIVYRRWGHNELDEPAYTQPLMYTNIRSRKSVPKMYEDKLVEENIVTSSGAISARASYKSYLEAELEASNSIGPNTDMLREKWSSMVWPASDKAVHDPDTGVDLDTLKRVGEASVQVPDGFNLHSRLQRHVKARLNSLKAGSGIDWATAEALAFGSLMLEGQDVRISGQDVGRGTFSQRHAMLVDQVNENVVVPLNDNLGSEGKLELANSSLSEMGVLGFEYGMSWETPRLLPIWEAQFGDFFNGAQIIIDTFISSSETKWLRQSGIVLILPHGLDGAGPEHSSSRIERMLQLTNDRYSPEDPIPNINMHVVYPTTPAQIFHLLRRQLKRNYRKPLIIVGPKGLLRLPAAACKLEELGPQSKFQPVISDPSCDPSTAERVVFLTGKIYYDLVKERAQRGLDGRIAFVRIEELSPFPFARVIAEFERFKHLKPSDVFWLQEEHRNQGAWTHVAPRLAEALRQVHPEAGYKVQYLGRKEDAVPAVGYGRKYQEQQAAVIASAFTGLA